MGTPSAVPEHARGREALREERVLREAHRAVHLNRAVRHLPAPLESTLEYPRVPLQYPSVPLSTP